MSISAGSRRRGLRGHEVRGHGARVLQRTSGVKVEFAVGVSDANRAAFASNKLNRLAEGALVQQFSRQLDAELEARGEALLCVKSSLLVVAIISPFSRPTGARSIACEDTRHCP